MIAICKLIYIIRAVSLRLSFIMGTPTSRSLPVRLRPGETNVRLVAIMPFRIR
jgi:hypothetical protein